MQEAESMHTLVFLLPSHVNTQFQTNFLLLCFILFSNSRLFRRQLKFSGGLLITLFQDNLGFWNQGKPNRDLHISNHRDLKSPLTLEMSDVFSASLAPEMKCHDSAMPGAHGSVAVCIAAHQKTSMEFLSSPRISKLTVPHCFLFSHRVCFLSYFAFSKKKFDFMIN